MNVIRAYRGRDKNAVKSSRTWYGRTISVVWSYREPDGRSADVVKTKSGLDGLQQVRMPRPRRPYYVCNTFLLRPTSSYYMYYLTSSLLRLIQTRPHQVSFKHVQNLTKTFTSFNTSFFLTTFLPRSTRPYHVLILGRTCSKGEV